MCFILLTGNIKTLFLKAGAYETDRLKVEILFSTLYVLVYMLNLLTLMQSNGRVFKHLASIQQLLTCMQVIPLMASR